MIKILDSAREYLYFIRKINNDPMLCTDEQIKCNLIDAENKKNTNYIFGIFEEQELIGLFVFLILEDENYIEMLVGLSKNPKAYNDILAFLKTKYMGYNIDFVYNPHNYILHRILKNEKAKFEVEQQKMVLTGKADCKLDNKNVPIGTWKTQGKNYIIIMYRLR